MGPVVFHLDGCDFIHSQKYRYSENVDHQGSALDRVGMGLARVMLLWDSGI